MPSTNGHGPKRAILYARVSTDEQGKSGYSIPEQLRELRAYAARERYRMVEEAVDEGHSGADPHRPGLRHVMELAEGGAIDVVLAKKRNRLFRSRLYRLLWDQDLGDLGVKLVALDDTGNRFGDAMQDEEQAWEFVRGLLRDPERIRAGLDRLIWEERAEAGRDPERDAEFWSRKITEVERRGYHRLAAKGHMTDQELAAALSELDEIRETAERELETTRSRGEALQRLEHDRDALMESYTGMVSETLEDLSPEERSRVYKLLRLGVRFRPDWPLKITGVFAQVEEVAERGSSDRKPSSVGV